VEEARNWLTLVIVFPQPRKCTQHLVDARLDLCDARAAYPRSLDGTECLCGLCDLLIALGSKVLRFYPEIAGAASVSALEMKEWEGCIYLLSTNTVCAEELALL
jgi:hypothetical protein